MHFLLTIAPIVILFSVFSELVRAAPPLIFPSSTINGGTPIVNSYTPDFGTFIGRIQSFPSSASSNPHQNQHKNALGEGSSSTATSLASPSISGLVYAVNESAIQIVNFTFNGEVPDTFFWLDRDTRPTRDGIRLSTFEYGLSPLGPYPPSSSSSNQDQHQRDIDFGAVGTTADFFTSNDQQKSHHHQQQQKVSSVSKKASNKRENSPGGSITEQKFTRVVLILPDDVKLSAYRSLSLYSLSDANEGRSLATIHIPENLIVPRTQLLYDELRGQRYGLSSGVIQLIDARTVKIFGFMFQGDKAPDGYFYVGRGLNVSKDAGVKAVIRGRDIPEFITPMSERYTGGQDIFVELPEGYTIHSIDWISVYCLRYEIDFGHVFLKNVSRTVPPFVPLQRSFEEDLEAVPIDKRWNVTNLVGIPRSQLNFTFQLGPPGGILGYRSMMFIGRAPQYVWYVNGYMAADLYLKRGVNYTFIVEGGRNITGPPMFHNPLYLSNSSYGGYAKLSNSERQEVRKYLPREASGRLCRWEEEKGTPTPDEFSTFVDYRDWLKLECEGGNGNSLDEENPLPPSSILWFVPDKETPDLIFYGSYSNYQMGGRIFIVDDFPADLEHVVFEAYHYDANAHKAKLQQELSKHDRNSASTNSKGYPLFSLAFSIFALFLLARIGNF